MVVITDIQQIIAEIKARTDHAGGLRNVYFVGCGGSQAAIYPGKYLLDAEAKSLSVKIYNSNEFVHCPPASLGDRSLVVCCSLKATPETVEAVKTAKGKGAITIAMTGSADTGMAAVGDYVVTYSNGDDQIYSQSNQSQVLRIAFEILHQMEGYDRYQAAMKAFGAIDGLVEDSKKRMLPAAQEFAKRFKDNEVFYVLASGPLHGTAYTMVNCHLIEMQCRHGVHVHSGEYFHGPFETTDNILPMILLMSTGRTRPLDQRVRNFLESRAGNHIVIDMKNTGIEEKIDPAVAEYFSSVVMIPIERFFVSTMAELRGRSMDERRYMWKFEY